MATMNISLPDEMKKFVEAQVATGLYANASDYMRDVLRDRMRAYEDLLEALRVGEESGISERTPEEIAEAALGRHR
ncbi:MAG: type II toxin-antitoxin system ParD family antitoxin [Sphingobium sp.]|nr:MAG: type II toxin-antitoxin system ParD family antitoxin [Sphingobium sp.]